MVSAVHLDHEACGVANEIDNERTDRRLAAKALAGKSMCSQ